MFFTLTSERKEKNSRDFTNHKKHKKRFRVVEKNVRLYIEEKSSKKVRKWCRWRVSNPQPAAYKAAALPIELHRLSCTLYTKLYIILYKIFMKN